MTRGEYREIIFAMDDDTLDDFQNRFGGEPKTREELVRHFDPKHELSLCYLLETITGKEILTEEEKRTRATVDAAKAAKHAALAAIISAGVAALSAAVVLFRGC